MCPRAPLRVVVNPAKEAPRVLRRYLEALAADVAAVPMQGDTPCAVLARDIAGPYFDGIKDSLARDLARLEQTERFARALLQAEAARLRAELRQRRGNRPARGDA